DGKAASSHSHAISDVTNLQSTLNGKVSFGDLQSELSLYLPLSGGTMGGDLFMDGWYIDMGGGIVNLAGGDITMNGTSGSGGGTINMDGGTIEYCSYIDMMGGSIEMFSGDIYMSCENCGATGGGDLHMDRGNINNIGAGGISIGSTLDMAGNDI